MFSSHAELNVVWFGALLRCPCPRLSEVRREPFVISDSPDENDYRASLTAIADWCFSLPAESDVFVSIDNKTSQPVAAFHGLLVLLPILPATACPLNHLRFRCGLTSNLTFGHWW
jgi:hypothetical protein